MPPSARYLSGLARDGTQGAAVRMSGRQTGTDVLTAAANAVSRVTGSGQAGTMRLLGMEQGPGDVRLLLAAPDGAAVPMRVELAALPDGRTARLLAGASSGYPVIQLSAQAAPGAAAVYVASRLYELQAAMGARSPRRDLLVPGSPVPPPGARLTSADIDRLRRLGQDIRDVQDVRLGKRARAAALARFRNRMASLGLGTAESGDAAARARRELAAAAVDSATAAAIRDPRHLAADGPGVPRGQQAPHGPATWLRDPAGAAAASPVLLVAAAAAVTAAAPTQTRSAGPRLSAAGTGTAPAVRALGRRYVTRGALPAAGRTGSLGTQALKPPRAALRAAVRDSGPELEL